MRLDGVEGEPLADRELVELHGHLVRVVVGVTGDRPLAEDAAQEALARLWEQEKAGRGPDHREAWTTRVALNWARSRLRRRVAESRAVRRLHGRATSPGGSASESGALSADLLAVLRTMPYRQREVVVLHYLADLDVATIAGVVGISAGAVKNAPFNGRRALAGQIDRRYHDRGGVAIGPPTDAEEAPS